MSWIGGNPQSTTAGLEKLPNPVELDWAVSPIRHIRIRPERPLGQSRSDPGELDWSQDHWGTTPSQSGDSGLGLEQPLTRTGSDPGKLDWSEARPTIEEATWSWSVGSGSGWEHPMAQAGANPNELDWSPSHLNPIIKPPSRSDGTYPPP